MSPDPYKTLLERLSSKIPQEGGTERRKNKERRGKGERREDCIPVSDWTSVCPVEDEDDSPDEEP